jgi:hypothetical protein
MGTLFALTNDCSPVGRFFLLLYGKQIDEVNLRSWPEADLRHLDLVVDNRPIAEAGVYDLLAPKRLLEP